MSLLSWAREILAAWWPFVSNRKAWRDARKAEKIRAERKALSQRYLAGKKKFRPNKAVLRRLDELTRMELELGNRQ